MRPYGIAMMMLGMLLMAIAFAGNTNQLNNEKLALQQAAIDRGFALYCPNNGEFAWRDECEK